MLKLMTNIFIKCIQIVNDNEMERNLFMRNSLILTIFYTRKEKHEYYL